MNDAVTAVDDDEGGIPDARRLMVRLAASLIFAVFAYLGFVVGGDTFIGASAKANSFSSSGRDPQPPHLTAREAMRGVLAAERKAPAKSVWQDIGAAIPAFSPALIDPRLYELSPGIAGETAPRAFAPGAYYSQGPPSLAA